MSTGLTGLRRSLSVVNTGSYTFGTGWVLGPTFPIATDFRPHSTVKMTICAPGRNDSANWGGMYVEVQVSINGGSWQSLGSTGFDTVMTYSAASILTYRNTLIFNPKQSEEYSLQFRWYLKTYDGTGYLNDAHNLNAVSGTASWHTDGASTIQHYAHMILEEFNQRGL